VAAAVVLELTVRPIVTALDRLACLFLCLQRNSPNFRAVTASKQPTQRAVDEMGDNAPPTVDATRAAWAIAKPERRNYGTVVTELNSSRLVGEGSVLERGPHVPVTHMGYFKPPICFPLRIEVAVSTIREGVGTCQRSWRVDRDGASCPVSGQRAGWNCT